MSADNLLSRMRAADISRAQLSLPAIDSTIAKEASATIDVDGLGRVKVVFTRLRHKRARSSFEFWAVERAERVDE